MKMMIINGGMHVCTHNDPLMIADDLALRKKKMNGQVNVIATRQHLSHVPSSDDRHHKSFEMAFLWLPLRSLHPYQT